MPINTSREKRAIRVPNKPAKTLEDVELRQRWQQEAQIAHLHPSSRLQLAVP